MKTPIKQLIFETLTVSDFEIFKINMAVTETKFTRLINGVDAWKMAHIQNLSTALKLNPLKILDKYELNNSITLQESERLTKWYEKELQTKI